MNGLENLPPSVGRRSRQLLTPVIHMLRMLFTVCLKLIYDGPHSVPTGRYNSAEMKFWLGKLPLELSSTSCKVTGAEELCLPAIHIIPVYCTSHTFAGHLYNRPLDRGHLSLLPLPECCPESA